MTKSNQDADVAFIQALAELLRENDLTELQVKRDYGEDDSLNVRVSRHTAQQVVTQVAAAPAPVAAAPAAAAPADALQQDGGLACADAGADRRHCGICDTAQGLTIDRAFRPR